MAKTTSDYITTGELCDEVATLRRLLRKAVDDYDAVMNPSLEICYPNLKDDLANTMEEIRDFLRSTTKGGVE